MGKIWNVESSFHIKILDVNTINTKKEPALNNM